MWTKGADEMTELEGMATVVHKGIDEILRLRKINADLLEALKLLLSHPSNDYLDAVDTEDGYTLTPLAIAERKAKDVVLRAEERS